MTVTAPSSQASPVPSAALYYADLHVHVGRSEDGRIVKVSAPASMTLRSVLQAARLDRGLDMVAVVDGHSPAVQDDVKRLVDLHELVVEESGVLSYHGLVLILGSEVEVRLGGARVHVVLLFPNLWSAGNFSGTLRGRVANASLSTPLWPGHWTELADWAEAAGAVFFPAHIFTPHRGVLAAGIDEARPLIERSRAVELGLSADTAMAAPLSVLAGRVFLSNSDAHSQGRVAREYNVFALHRPTAGELNLALQGRDGRRVVANYGLDPALGKYHRTWCPTCDHISTGPPPLATCELCGSDRVVLGVADRVALLARHDATGLTPSHDEERPPYVHQVPLRNIPGIGARTYARLLAAFGSERAVLHEAPPGELAAVCGQALAERIVAVREERVRIAPGGGGHWGRVVWQ